MEEIVLTKLQYAAPGAGPWRLYIYADGKHGGGQWFRKGPLQYPDEEITFAAALKRMQKAFKLKREIRVTDSGDKLVFRAQYGIVVYGHGFWEQTI